MVSGRFPTQSRRLHSGLARLLLPALLVISLSFAYAASASAQNSEPLARTTQITDAKEQLKFGVNMARRGLWSEALFRFKQADRLDPGSPRILNNVAVAYEALGQFDKALATYQEAIRRQSSDRDLRKNYSRFVEFYRAFRPDDQKDASLDTSQTANDNEPPSPAVDGQDSSH